MVMKMINNTNFMRKRRGKFQKRYPKTNFGLSLAGKVLGVQKQVDFIKGIVNAERKYTDVSLSQSPSNTGLVQLINQIAQGDDSNNRDGISILHKYVRCEISVVIGASATNTFCRYMIVQDTAGQGSTPAVTDILTSASVDSLKNSDNQKRFIVLRDKRFNINTAASPGKVFKEYITTNFHCRYSAAGATTVLQNALYLLLLSGEATNVPSFGFNCRNAFYDN